MKLTVQQLIALLPLLIIGLTIVIVILHIALRRNYLVNVTLTVIGLNVALLSLFFVWQNGVQVVTPLMYVDSLSTFYTGLIIIASLTTSILAYRWLFSYPGNRDEFYILVLIATSGGILLTNANHLAALFLGIELTSLPLFGMIGYVYQQKQSLEASVKYTLLSATASSFLLFGIALVYASIGHLSFTMISQFLNDSVIKQKLLMTGLGMMIVGLGFKLSLVPFHLWTPDVYQGAPATVSSFLTTVSKISILAIVIRLFLLAPVTNNKVLWLTLAIIAVFSMLLGNLMAINQSNIKNILGCSSIAHLGYLLIGLIEVQASTLALETISIYLVGYLLANLGAFGVISVISSPYNGKDKDSISAYVGLFWRKPVLSIVLTIMILSLAGIPMTLGFIGKFYLIALSLNTNLWWLTSSAIIVSSAIGLFYYLRIMISLYLSPPKNLQYDVISTFNWLWLLTPSEIVLLIASLLILLLGFYPQPLISLVQLAKPTL